MCILKLYALSEWVDVREKRGLYFQYLTMATIFLSYRRTDGPQACRIYDWLSARFGGDAVFMDVAAIPFAVSFSEFIREAIEQSRVLIALIGPDWHERIAEPNDSVCMEICLLYTSDAADDLYTV